MNTLSVKTTAQICAESMRYTSSTLHIQLDDGGKISWPLAEVPGLKWLAKATPKQRANCWLEPGGFAIYRPDLDDSIEVCHLLDVQPIT